MLSSLSLCIPREWSLHCSALSGPFATTGIYIYIYQSLEEGPPTWRTLGTHGMLFNFQRLSGRFMKVLPASLSLMYLKRDQKRLFLWAFGVQNGDFWSSGSIFSVHPETLLATGAPKGEIKKIKTNLSSAWGAIWGSFSKLF